MDSMDFVNWRYIMTEINEKENELIIIKTTKKTQVFSSFSYPFGDIEFYRKMRGTPRCYKCRSAIRKIMALGFARKGSNRVFCLPCVTEFKNQGCEVTDVRKKGNQQSP